jgi:phage gp29-like protein
MREVNPQPKKLTLAQRIRAFFTGEIPVVTQTVYNYRAAPLTIATLMDVDRIHEIFSDAESGNVQDLFALYRDIVLADSHLQAEFATRKRAVIGDPLTIQPADKKNPLDVQAAAWLNTQLKPLPAWFLRASAHLMDGILWPVAICEKIYAPTPDGGYRLERLVPVPDQLIDYRLGKLALRSTDPRSGYPNGDIFDPDENRYLIHRGHLLSVPDNWGGPMRSLVFWWFFSAMDRDNWARFLDRYGSPFLVGKYDQSDDASRTVLERAFSNATKLFGVVISKDTQVELQQASSAQAGEAFEKFHDIACREKSKLIVGQTGSQATRSTGLGSGVSRQQEAVRDDIRQFDSIMLSATLTEGLFHQLLQINGRVGKVRCVWGSEDEKVSAELARTLADLATAQLGIADASIPMLSERLGFQVQRLPDPSAKGPSMLSSLAASSPERLTAALDSIAGAGAADTARHFRRVYAPLARAIRDAKSPEEVLAHVRSFSAGWSPEQTAQLLTEALQSYAANGAVVTDR